MSGREDGGGGLRRRIGLVLGPLLLLAMKPATTAVMMLPIGLSVLELVRERGGETDPRGHFGTSLMLGIAYACSIGGLGTLIGTPPNAFLAGFLSETYGVEVTFVRWMAFGLPLVLVGLPLAWWVLTRGVFPHGMDEIPGGRAFLREKRAGLGPTTTPERRVAVVFGAVALAWITRPLLSNWIPGLSDAGIAVTGGLVLFLLPAGGGEGRPLLAWEEAERLPWGVLVLFGGGLSLARAMDVSGLAAWIGRSVGALEALPFALILAGVATLFVVVQRSGQDSTRLPPRLRRRKRPWNGGCAGAAGARARRKFEVCV
jgi:sodium-dependent dicarboxylate transporter 2/3/5